MGENLEFAKSYNYNTTKSGISLPVILQSGEAQIEVHAKLDTGSTHCIFESEYAELLDIDNEKGEPITIITATGKFRAFEHRVTLITFGLSWEATVCFIAEEGIKRNVLGRQGWLDRVKLGIIDYDGKLLLSALSEDYQN